MDERPIRVQLSRRKGFRLQEVSKALNGLPCVKVDRSTWAGNPWRVLPCYGRWVVHSHHDLPVGGLFETREAALAYSLAQLRQHVEENPEPLEELRGKNLACWCKVGEPCHADVLLELANPDTSEAR